MKNSCYVWVLYQESEPPQVLLRKISINLLKGNSKAIKIQIQKLLGVQHMKMNLETYIFGIEILIYVRQCSFHSCYKFLHITFGFPNSTKHTHRDYMNFSLDLTLLVISRRERNEPWKRFETPCATAIDLSRWEFQMMKILSVFEENESPSWEMTTHQIRATRYKNHSLWKKSNKSVNICEIFKKFQ